MSSANGDTVVGDGDMGSNKSEAGSISDSSEEEMDEVAGQEEVAKLTAELEANPRTAETRERLITLLRRAGELEQLRAARKRMVQFCPMSEALWLNWVEDEKSVDDESSWDVLNNAIDDCFGLNLWLEFCSVAIGRYMATDPSRLRDKFTMAVSTIGLHVTDGSLIWDTYLEYEELMLQGLEAVPEAERTAEQQASVKKQLERVADTYKLRLSVPLVEMEKTWAAYEEFCGSRSLEVSAEARQNYQTAIAALHARKGLEEEVLTAEPGTKDAVNVFHRYIDFEKGDRTFFGDFIGNRIERIVCVFERALQDNFNELSLWESYVTFLELEESRTKQSWQLLSVSQRALRSFPASSRIHIARLLALEDQQSENPEEILLQYDAAAQIPTFRAADIEHLYTTYCDALRRAAAPVERVNSQLEVAETRLLELGASQNLERVYKYWARSAARSGAVTQAREIWNRLLTNCGCEGIAWTWLDYFYFELQFGDAKHVRRLFQRALKSVTDDVARLSREYLSWEREHGTLKQLREALVLTEAALEKLRADKKSRPAGKPTSKFASKFKTTETVRQTSAGPSSGQSSQRPAPAGKQRPGLGLKRGAPEGVDFKAPEPKIQRKAAPTPVDVQEGADPKKIFVSNLPRDVADDELHAVFEPCGEIEALRVVRRAGNVFSYIEFSQPDCIGSALALDRSKLRGRPMYVSGCFEKEGTASRESTFGFATEEEKNKLYVKGIAVEVSEEELKMLYSGFGGFKTARLVVKRTGESKGCAFIEFATPAQATAALMSTDGKELRGKSIEVAISKPPARGASKAEPAGKRPRDAHKAVIDGFVRQLGNASQKTDAHGNARTQIGLTPRALQLAASGPTSAALPRSAPSTAPKSNDQFRDMLLKKEAN